MACLTREAILNAEDLKRELVTVTGWGGDVFVRSLTGKERDAFELSMVSIKGKTRETKLENLRARLVALTVVHENGVRLFSEKDIPALGEKSAECLDLVFDVAQKLSGLHKEDVDELTKNSDAPQNDDFISG